MKRGEAFKDGGGKQRGQGTVEFALSLMVLLMLFMGLVEFGRMLFIYISVNTSSREAARYGSAAGEGGGTPRYKDCDGIRNAAVNLGRFAGVETSGVTITYDSGPGESIKFSNCEALVGSSSDVELGDRIIVTVSTQYVPMQVIPFFNVPGINLTSSSARMIVKDVVVGSSPATATVGPTATSALCNMSAGTLVANDGGKYVQFSIENNSGSQVELFEIVIGWPTGYNGDLKEISFGGNTIFDTQTGSSPLEIPLQANWKSGSQSKRRINDGEAKLLRFDFDLGAQSSGYSIAVTFDNGCTVYPTGGGPSTATATATPTITDTPSAPTATPTATPVPPAAPVHDSITNTSGAGQQCESIEWTFGPNADWASNPGGSPVNYQVYQDSVSYGTISANDPDPTTWSVPNWVAKDDTTELQVLAVFSGPVGSETLTMNFVCNNGVLLALP